MICCSWYVFCKLTISCLQASTFVIMFGLLFIFLENHLDGRAIICQGGDQYARSDLQTC